MTTLASFLRCFADPVLLTGGFTPGSTTYYRERSNGDQDIVWFQKISPAREGTIQFRPVASSDPQLCRDVMRNQGVRNPTGPPAKMGLWHQELSPRLAGQCGDWILDQADDAQMAEVGRALTLTLKERALPLLDQLSDARKFEEALRDAGKAWNLSGSLFLGRPDSWPLAIVVAGQRQDDEVDEILLQSIREISATSGGVVDLGYLPSLAERLSSGDYPHRSKVLAPALQGLRDSGVLRQVFS